MMYDDILYALSESVKNSLIYNQVTCKTAYNVIIPAHHLTSPTIRELMFKKEGVWDPLEIGKLNYHIESNDKGMSGHTLRPLNTIIHHTY